MSPAPHNSAINKAVETLRAGGLIAYPTESVFGLGCDPFNAQAVTRLLALKNRPQDKGLILIASSWEQIQSLTECIPESNLSQIQKTWPGPTTWVFPANHKVPQWIRGMHPSIALRVTDHPIAQRLCHTYQGPIVSTSANRSGEPPLRDSAQVYLNFSSGIDYILPGSTGGQTRPTAIYDACTFKQLRF